MRLEQVLFSQGFGTRHECRGYIELGRVTFDGKTIKDPDEEVRPEGKSYAVDGVSWPFFEKALIALYKPQGYECSQKPTHHPSVMALLPSILRARGVQPVGRLDEDTTGVLLLTDDGALTHRLTHPKKHVSKTYRVTLKHAADPSICEKLIQGVLLVDDKETVCAKNCVLTNSNTLEMTITSGKYHQVKRMIAAAGNRCVSLHRLAFGSYRLPPTLKPGEWVWIKDRKEVF